MTHESNATTVVLMGDSITEGQYVPPEYRWGNLLAARLKALAAEENLGEVTVYNRGISGETTRQGLERFPADVQALAPQLMTLQFGLNDCNFWATDRGLPRVSPAAYRANLVEMIGRARRFGTTEIILSTNHPTLRRAALAGGITLEDHRLLYNEIVREVAKELGVTLCDIEAAFSDLDDIGLAGALLPPPDVLHLSYSGHERYCEAILPFVAAALRRSARIERKAL